MRGTLDEVECLGVPADGLVGGELVQGSGARQARIADGLGAVVGLDGGGPVVGELAGALAGIGAELGFERLADRAVGSGAARRGEAVVEGVFDQSVGERVAIGAVGRLALGWRRLRRRGR